MQVFKWGILLCLLSQPGISEAKRLALVIGNQEYKHFDPLKNPINDTVLLKQSLENKNLQFQVMAPVKNATRKDLIEALRNFNAQIAEGDIALVYYSGHGLQHENDSWLVPVEADIQLDNEIPDQSISSDQVLGYLKRAATKIVILDACRDNSLRHKGGGKGLGRDIVQVKNTLCTRQKFINLDEKDKLSL